MSGLPGVRPSSIRPSSIWPASIRPSSIRSCAVLVGSLLLGAGEGRAQPVAEPSVAARNAAMGELITPGGVGGCVFLGVSRETRREALVGLMSGRGGFSPALRAAVADVAPSCTGRPHANSDLALVGAVTATFRRASAALALAQQYGVGQQGLDAAWGAASPPQKAPIYAVAEDYLSPTADISPRPLDVSPFAEAVGMTTAQDRRGETLLRMYLINTALSERAETLLADQGARPVPK